MRNFKKALSLCLVLVLLVGTLSITAFATDTYTVKFYVNGTEQTTWQRTGTVGQNVYTTVSTLTNPLAVFNDVEDYYIPGTYHKALISIGSYGPTHASYADIPDEYFDDYDTITTTTNPYYFILETGPQGYHYLYLGYAWTYHYIGGADLWDYMDDCYPTANRIVEVVYSLQASDFWSTSVIG